MMRVRNGDDAISGPDGKTAIAWFRKDLRIADNPALQAALANGGPVACIYIREDIDGVREPGGASDWWLDKSLRALDADLRERGNKLILRQGDPKKVLPTLVDELGAKAVFWNRRYGKIERETDTDLKQTLKESDIHVESFNAALLTEPWTQQTSSGGYYKVFTPYWKSVRASYAAPDAIAPAKHIPPSADIASDSIDDWDLHPANPDWSEGFDDVWTPGETGALDRLERFLETGLSDYSDQRNRPDIDHGTSGLSPHLAFGEISPARIWRAVRSLMDRGSVNDDSAWTFLSELCWRDFSYVLLYHNPSLATENYNGTFDLMPWRDAPEDLRAWQRGQTGYPIVDAGMRQLWTTGWMHNRVRMIVASFLTKHLLLHWSEGEDWFWDTLVDADPASNSASWQWTAGSGADAAPYFRVFNPITQGEKFDPDGDYVRTWCPELADLPTKHLFAPWQAPSAALDKAGITLGETYPKPLIDHKAGRQRALDAYDTLKERRDAA